MRIKIHNSIVCIRGRNQRILREKLYRVLGSRSWNHGLNGELCPEHFQNGPRNLGFFGGEASAPPRPYRLGDVLGQSGPRLWRAALLHVA